MNEQLRAVITGVIQKGTVLRGVSFMSPADRLEAHEEQMVANLLAAIEPVVEMEIEARVAEQGLDHPEERAFGALSDRVARLDRQSIAAADAIALHEQRIAAFERRESPMLRQAFGCRRCNGTGLIQCLPSQNQGAAMKTCDACSGQGVVR